MIQKVATSDEAEQMISQGWKFIGTLSNSKVVLEKGFAPNVSGPGGI